MSDFGYFPDSFNPPWTPVGGGTVYPLVSTEVVGNAISMDRAIHCDTFQVIASEHRADHVNLADQSNDKPYIVRGDVWTPLAQVYYKLPPEGLPGSDNQTTSSGTTIQTKGGLCIAVVGARFFGHVLIEKATLGGSYGQSTTFSLRSRSSISAANGVSGGTPEVRYLTDGTTGFVKFATGIQSGDYLRITLLATNYPGSSFGWINSWTIFESYMASVAP